MKVYELLDLCSVKNRVLIRKDNNTYFVDPLSASTLASGCLGNLIIANIDIENDEFGSYLELMVL